MNLKKFISSVSALAIAASAFAGLAVVANAEATVAYSQNFDTPVYVEAEGGNYNLVDGEYVEVEAGTGSYAVSTNPADYGYTLSYGAGSNSNLVNFSVTNNYLNCVYGPYANQSDGARSGLALATFNAIGTGNEVTVSYTWSNGTATGNASGSWTETYVADSAGKKVLSLKFFGSDGGKLTLNDNQILKDTKLRNRVWTVTAKLDMSTKKITALTIGSDYTLSEAVDFQNADAANVAQFGFQNSERQSWADVAYVDNISITYEEAKIPAGLVTVNYVDSANDNVLFTSTTGSTNYYGDAYSSYLPAYYESNGKLYKYDNIDNANGWSAVSGTYTDQAVELNYKYTAVDAINYTYYEGSGTDATNPQYTSGGSVRNFGASPGTQTLFSAPDDGIYTIIVANGYRSAWHGANDDTSITVKINDVADTERLPSFRMENANAYAKTYENIELKEGDIVTATTAYSRVSIDYAVLLKTAELPTPEADLKATVGNVETVSGTGSYAAEQATLFTVTVKNEGDAEGSYNRVSVTDGNAKFTAEVPQITLAASETAEVIYGGVVEGAYTFNAASVSYVE